MSDKETSKGPPEGYRFRPVDGKRTWPDVTGVWRSTDQLYPGTCPEVERLYAVGLDPTTVLQATLGNEAVAAVMISPRNAGNALTQRLGVKPEERNHGLGRHMTRLSEALRIRLGISSRVEVLTAGSTVDWYREQGYGGSPETEYQATGLLKDIKMSKDEMMELLDQVEIPDSMAEEATITLYERHLYFSFNDHSYAPKLHYYYGPGDLEELKQSLGARGPEQLQGIEINPNDSHGGLYVPTTMPREIYTPGVVPDTDETDTRLWQGIYGYQEHGHLPVRLLRQMEFGVDDDNRYKKRSLGIDGRYMALRGNYGGQGAELSAITIEDGECRLMDEKESNRFRMDLLGDLSHYNTAKPPRLPVSNPRRVNRELRGM